MDLEHHRDLAHEFPELKARIHALKLESAEFRRLYREYQSLDNAIHRIEQEIETPSDAFTEALKFRRVWLKDHLHGLLTGRIVTPSEVDLSLVQGRFPPRARPEDVQREWAARGYSCHDESAPPGDERAGLVHDVDSLLTVRTGRLVVTVAGADWILEPGDELAIPAGDVHGIRNDSAHATHWMFGCAGH